MAEKKKFSKIVIIIIAIVALLVGGYYGYEALKDNKPKTDTPEKKKEFKEIITPLLYEVTKEGINNKIYLFGSIHATKQDEFVYPEYVLKAYNESHYVGVEADINAYQQDLEKQAELAKTLLCNDGSTLKDHLTSETYTKAINFLKSKNSYNSLFESYKPYVIQSTLSELYSKNAGIDPNYGVDKYFLQKAVEDHKTIIELESVEYQNNLLIGSPDELYDLLISEGIDNFDESVESVKKLYEAWKKGDSEKLYEYSMSDTQEKNTYTPEQNQLLKNYNKNLIDDRSFAMLQKVMDYYNKNQDVFIVVGALHIIGDSGLAKQLEQNGFIVNQVK